MLVLGVLAAPASSAAPFPEVVIRPAPPHSHRTSYLCMGLGVGLIGSSFLFADRANRAYDDYLVSTDPVELERLYEDTVRYDRLSNAALLSGEVLVATGLYLRFLRRPEGDRVSLAWGARRCALSVRF